MKHKTYPIKLLLLSVCASAFLTATAQNPVIRHLYTADPTARVFNGKIYIPVARHLSARRTTERLVLHGRLPCVFFREPDRLD